MRVHDMTWIDSPCGLSPFNNGWRSPLRFPEGFPEVGSEIGSSVVFICEGSAEYHKGHSIGAVANVPQNVLYYCI